MNTTAPELATALPKKHPRSSRGTWTIVAIFALGAIVCAGLFLAPHAKSPATPPGIPWGTPARSLKVICYEVAIRDGIPAVIEPDTFLAELRQEAPDPDYVLLLNVDADMIPALATGLGMSASFEPRLYQRVPITEASHTLTGVCILSRHPLYEATPVRPARNSSLGVQAVSVVDGRKFLVACAAPRTAAPQELDALWRQAGQPPMMRAWEQVSASPATTPASDVDRGRPLQLYVSPASWSRRTVHRWSTQLGEGVLDMVAPADSSK